PDVEDGSRQSSSWQPDLPAPQPAGPPPLDPTLERIASSLQPEAMTGGDAAAGAVTAGAPQHDGVQRAAIPADSAVGMLHRMGVPSLESHGLPILNSYFACLMSHARQVSERRWPQVLEAAGLERYLNEDPADDGERTASADECSRLAEAFEIAFGADAPAHLRTLGRTVTDEWLRTTQPKPFRMMGKPESKVADALYVFNHSMDRVRGEPLHAWKQIDKRQFWIVHYANLFALGRLKPAKSCHFWVAAFESALRWGGLANDWAVEETECGCATGTFCCVFTVERVGG
ncbi:MAG TPA: hypothetical protein VLW53_08870, partial [Candidatus Eisenbacteria bacterium]|nr:hypothetical protein [Candidatus Eisenbacteria bacterium]